MLIISRRQLEALAIKVVEAYRCLPELKDQPVASINPVLLANALLHLDVQYDTLSSDGTILGMTSFDSVTVEVVNAAEDVIQSIALDTNMIKIEKKLTEEKYLAGRCNFTIMHECSHHILKRCFPQAYCIGIQEKQPHFLRSNVRKTNVNRDWEEWQANVLTSAALMPRQFIDHFMSLFGWEGKLRLYPNNKLLSAERYLIACMSDFLGVSRSAMFIRLKELGYMNQLTKEQYGEDCEMDELIGGILYAKSKYQRV